MGFFFAALIALSISFEPGKTPQQYTRQVPEGNYLVTVDFPAGSETTVKAELRRLVLEKVAGPAKRSFVVNVRNSSLPQGASVSLKDREKTSEAKAWDDSLTLEFSGKRPAVTSIEIKPISVPTVYIAGDSTVADQPTEPFASWGQMLTRFFGNEVAIANHAESGESLFSFIAEKRLEKLATLFKPGDYLMIQMGHNDQKRTGEGAGAFTTYKADLKTFIAEARKHQVTPILITSMHRRTFDSGGKITNSLGDFPEAVRQVANEENLALIDLHEMSKRLYEALGPVESVKAFAPGDGTHHNSYGAYELARCVVESIRSQKLPIAKYLAPDVKPFDPAHPDPIVPSLFLVGDSTVRNGRGDGSNGQWGWGEPLVERFDDSKISVFNRALGGRNSRTFQTGGQWEQVLRLLKPGDYVLMQFGHNDGGPLDDTARARGTLQGIGDESKEIDNPITGKHETVYSYGWYMRKYIEEARAKGAIPIVCTPIPRNDFRNGVIARDRYANWSVEVAKATNTPIIDLNELIRRDYEKLGPEEVSKLFHGDHTHTSRAGAEKNADAVARGLREIKSPLVGFLRD